MVISKFELIGEAMRNLFAIGSIIIASLAIAGERSHVVEVGGLFYSYDYKEVWTPPARSNELGFLPGFYVGYMYRGSAVPLFGKLNIEYTTSQTTYDGGIQFADGSYIPFTDKTKNIFKRFEVLGGYGFDLAKGRISLTPYAGYGYRFWRRTLPGGAAGYEEDYSWSYVSIGARTDYRFGDRWSASADIVLRIMFGGGLDVKRESFGNPTLHIGNKLGYKFSFPVRLLVGDGWSLVFEPWYESSGIAEGEVFVLDPNTGDGIREPESSTNIFGISAGVQFGF